MKLLEKFGNVKQFDFLFHKSGPLEGQPRGYCFVNFNTREVHARWMVYWFTGCYYFATVWILLTDSTDLCQSQTTRYFCLLKCSPCQIGRLKSHKFLQRCGRETWQTTHCSPDQPLFAVHDVRDVTSKEALTTDYYWQAVVGNEQKIRHASLSVVRLWGALDVASVCVHYDRLHEMQKIDCPAWCSLIVSKPIWCRTSSQLLVTGLISSSLTHSMCKNAFQSFLSQMYFLQKQYDPFANSFVVWDVSLTSG